ncbi:MULTISPECIES: hypothetical protein [Bradyrhizobium]|uniref:hypothetical protein n=1 Tax=Bradyrhizobium TaxID=374 RepID=UPI0020232EEB|nr:hypothetical protein [Bradyrhizobium denitrificans]MCL8482725.1 hypothetical protein [Bradyrhizobium denitrificans]
MRTVAQQRFGEVEAVAHDSFHRIAIPLVERVNDIDHGVSLLWRLSGLALQAPMT